MSTTCKEVNSDCKCIVKERVINNGNNGGNSSEDCTKLYKQLGTCISECLMEKCKERKKKQQADDC